MSKYKFTNKEAQERLNIHNPNLTFIRKCEVKGSIIVSNEEGFEFKTTIRTINKGPLRLTMQGALDKTSVFKHRSTIIHEAFYNYDKVNYVNAKTKVTITCPIHGDFEQTPINHLNGEGCLRCVLPDRAYRVGWNYNKWESSGNNSKYFDGFKVYIIELWNDNERFYKIGKTFNTLDRRFISLPYLYRVIDVITGDAIEISKLEHKLQKDNKCNRYRPQIEFGGHLECFTGVAGY